MASDPVNPLEKAEELFNQTLTPDITKEMQAELAKSDVAGLLQAKRSAYEAIVALCDFLNRWNADADGGPESVENQAILQKADSEIARALNVDPQLGLAYYAKGFILRTKGEHEEALKAFEQSLKLDKTYARAWAQAGAEQLYTGNPDKAVPLVRKAIELSKGSRIRGMYFWYMGRISFFNKNYDDAIAWLVLSTELWPKVFYNHLYLISALALAGDIEAAQKTLRDFDVDFPGYTLARVVRDEKTNPNANRSIIEMREIYHAGLLKAGMRP
jgi:tetratricopeptide (TPR) repeat protein